MVAKLSGSLIVYKDLPSAIQARSASQSADDVVTISAASPGEHAGAGTPPPAVDNRARPSSRMLRLCLIGGGLAAATAATLVFLGQAGGGPGSVVTPVPMANPASASTTKRAPPAPPVLRQGFKVMPSSTTLKLAPGIPLAPTTGGAAGRGPLAVDTAAPAEDDPGPPPGAPAPQVAQPIAAGRSGAARLTPEELAVLRHRGDQLFSSGDIATARLFYERAAEGGDTKAALRLGESYDPAFLAEAGLAAFHSDSAVAARWYRYARTIGSAEADALLNNVAAPIADRPTGEN